MLLWTCFLWIYAIERAILNKLLIINIIIVLEGCKFVIFTQNYYILVRIYGNNEVVYHLIIRFGYVVVSEYRAGIAVRRHPVAVIYMEIGGVVVSPELRAVAGGYSEGDIAAGDDKFIIAEIHAVRSDLDIPVLGADKRGGDSEIGAPVLEGLHIYGVGAVALDAEEIGSIRADR